MNNNLRIQRISDHLMTEVLAPVTTITWDPTAEGIAAAIRFDCHRYFKDAGGKYIGAQASDGYIHVSAAELVGTTIPMLGENGEVVGHLPAEAMIAALKGLFDQQYNIQRKAEHEPSPPADDAP